MKITKEELEQLHDEIDWQDRQDSIERVMELIDNRKKDGDLEYYEDLIKQIEEELWEFVN